MLLVTGTSKTEGTCEVMGEWAVVKVEGRDPDGCERGSS